MRFNSNFRGKKKLYGHVKQHAEKKRTNKILNAVRAQLQRQAASQSNGSLLFPTTVAILTPTNNSRSEKGKRKVTCPN